MTEENSGLDLRQWKEQQSVRHATVEDVLPSGLRVVRKAYVNPENLVLSGRLPMTILSQYIEDGDLVEVEMQDVLENIDDYVELIDAVFRAALVYPRIGEITDLDEGVLALSEFEDEQADKLYVLQEVLAPTEALSTFREEQP